jgi:hypothetical protein
MTGTAPATHAAPSGLLVLSPDDIERFLRRFPPQYPDPGSIDHSWRASGTASEVIKTFITARLRCPSQDEFVAEYSRLQSPAPTPGQVARMMQLYCGHIRELHAWGLLSRLLADGTLDALLWDHDLDANRGVDFLIRRGESTAALHARATLHWQAVKEHRHPPLPGLLHIDWLLDRLPPLVIGELRLFTRAHVDALARDLDALLPLSRHIGAPPGALAGVTRQLGLRIRVDAMGRVISLSVTSPSPSVLSSTSTPPHLSAS